MTMMHKPNRLTVGLVAVMMSTSWAAAAGAADERVALVQAVPSDVFICVAGRHNPERAFLDEYWGEVLRELKQCGIGDDVMALVTASLGEKDKAELDGFIAKAKELLAAVEWGKLVGDEVVFFERLPQPQIAVGNISMGPPDIGLLFRGSEGSAPANFDGLAAILETIRDEIAKATGKELPALERSERDGVKIAAWPFVALHPDAPPYGLRLALRGDIVIVTFGESVLEEVLDMLDGKNADRALVGDARFKAAFAKLPAAEDSLTFFDMQNLLGPIRKLIDAALPAIAQSAEQDAPAEGESGGDAKQWIALVNRIADVPSMLDYVASVQYTEGYTVRGESIVALVPGAEEKPFYPVFGRRAPMTDFARFLPQETVSFSVSNGIDLDALYAFIEDSVRMAGPDGEGLLAKWSEVQEQAGVNVRKDVIGWIDGDTVFVQLTGTQDWVAMLKVSDEQVAREKIGAALDFIAKFMADNVEANPMLAMLAVRTGPLQNENLPGFQRLYIGMNPPFVWGVAEGQVIFAQSESAIEKCLATAKGSHPGARENERVMQEAIIPDGPATAVSLSDMRQLHQQLAMGVGMMSMMGGMVAMAVPDPEARTVIAKVATMLGKLTPVVSKIDFYKSAASTTTFDGRAWRVRAATHYAKPEERPSAVSTTTN